MVDVYFFHGRYYHGSPDEGEVDSSWRGIGGATSAELFKQTQDVMGLFAAEGYNVYYILEGDFRRSTVKKNPAKLIIREWTLMA